MKCIRCGLEQNKKICSSCFTKWSEMRTQAMDFLTNKYGQMTAQNHSIFKTEIKRLENIWRKDPNLFIKKIMGRNKTDS